MSRPVESIAPSEASVATFRGHATRARNAAELSDAAPFAVLTVADA